MNVNLSIVLDGAGFIKKDLKIFKDLVELDFYTIAFQNSNDIRELFKREIEKYLKENKKYLKKYINNYQGRICITYYDKQNNVRFFPILYKKDIDFLKRKNNLIRISMALDDDDVLDELFSRKKYLLTKKERELLSLYLMTKKTTLKNTFISIFIERITIDANCYLYVRSLLNVCKLLKQNDDYYQLEFLDDGIEKKYKK